MYNSDVKNKVKQAMLCMTRQCWEQGIAAQALLELQDEKDLELVVHDIVLRQSEDGRLCNVESTPAITDSSFGIYAALTVGKKNNNKMYLEAAKKNVIFLLKHAERSEDGVIYHMENSQEIWADSAAFTPFSLALLGYYEEAVEQMKGLQKKLYDPEYQLYYHMWDEGEKEFKRKVLWGIGNGWFLTGLIRLYKILPDAYATEKKEIHRDMIMLLDAMLAWETSNHLFTDNLIDKDSFEETEVSEMIAYSIYVLVNEKILDRSYLERTDKIRNAIHKKVRADGLVSDCASSPDFLHPGTSVEGQAHFLMMEQAFHDCCSI